MRYNVAYTCRACHFHMYRNRAQNTRGAAGESSARIPKRTACRSIPSENPESSGTTSCPTVWMSFRPETGSRLFAFSSAAESPKTPLSTCSADHNFTECLHEKMLFWEYYGINFSIIIQRIIVVKIKTLFFFILIRNILTFLRNNTQSRKNKR